MTEQKRRLTTMAALAASVTLSILTGCSTESAAAQQAGESDAPAAPSTASVASWGVDLESSQQINAPRRDSSAAAKAVNAAPAAASENQATVIYAHLRSFNAATGVGTYDKVDAFFGEDAARKCAEDGETDTSNDRCTGYYYRNVNPRIRQIPVAPDAAIQTLEGADLVTGNAESLATEVQESGGRQLVKMRVEDNQAIAVTAIYLP